MKRRFLGTSKQIPSFMVSKQHLSWWHLSITGIFQLLLIKCWPNFKCRFLQPSLIEANCHGDLCPGNICPYQQYLSYCWSNFDQTFWTQYDLCGPKFFWTKLLLTLNFFGPNIFFSDQKITLDSKMFSDRRFFFWPKFFSKPNFLDQPFLFWDTNLFLNSKFFNKQMVWKP